jgi:hypothetical protein
MMAHATTTPLIFVNSRSVIICSLRLIFYIQEQNRILPRSECAGIVQAKFC